MHQAKIGIGAAALAGAIIIVLGVFQRDADDPGLPPEEGVTARPAPERASIAGAVGQRWATFGGGAAAVGAIGARGAWPEVIDSSGLTRGGEAPRRQESTRRRPSEQGETRGAAGAEAAEVGDPGAESWRLSGAKREGAVVGDGYREAADGERTEVTSGRFLGSRRVRVPGSPDLTLALAGRDGVPVRAEVCVDRKGRPTEVRVVEGTGVPSVDERVAQQLLAGKYRPLRRDGRSVEFCERATVVVTGP